MYIRYYYLTCCCSHVASFTTAEQKHAEAQRRVRSNLDHYQLNDPLTESRILCLSGDVSNDAQMGLSADDYERFIIGKRGMI